MLVDEGDVPAGQQLVDLAVAVVPRVLLRIAPRRQLEGVFAPERFRAPPRHVGDDVGVAHAGDRITASRASGE